jgi:hypothetical protein
LNILVVQYCFNLQSVVAFFKLKQRRNAQSNKKHKNAYNHPVDVKMLTTPTMVLEPSRVPFDTYKTYMYNFAISSFKADGRLEYRRGTVTRCNGGDAFSYIHYYSKRNSAMSILPRPKCSRTFVLARCVPWMMRLLDDASLGT